ncbi:DUF992 domain-containing protein [Mesorhizobium sp. WSM2239]|uniref:DUF992 domain-containing protein n=2 Tax=unclassified Mesorhizobium TaxID=325217 RepID=A0AAU8DDA1_9HYPH
MTHARMISTAVALALAPAMTISGVFVTTPASWAQTPTAYMGTLTCVLSPASEEPFGIERELSCDFEPVRAPRANLRGIVKRLGASVPDQGQIVMVWTVFGPSVDTPASHLQGRYVGSMGTESEYGLVGGAQSSIRLKPLTAAPDSSMPPCRSSNSNSA